MDSHRVVVINSPIMEDIVVGVIDSLTMGMVVVDKVVVVNKVVVINMGLDIPVQGLDIPEQELDIPEQALDNLDKLEVAFQA